MVAVAEQERVDVDVDAQVTEAPVGHRTLGQVVRDRVVAELFGRLDLDGHPAVAHGVESGWNAYRRAKLAYVTSKETTIAFVCAMPIELVPLTEKLALTDAEIEGVRVQTGTISGFRAVAIVTGMGTKFAREGVERLLDVVAVDWVVVVGITGALENETPIGTLVLPEVVVNSATGDE